ncbi:hypothetical protein KC973_00570 [Candidatus Saccharibacteria bacterium]|nr:hypothetical protein [Candidatus Saccharibacteria bacterium]
MENTNEDTLQAYESNAHEYIVGTPHEITGDVKKWVDKTLDGLPTDAKIFEIGSAFGRGATYIESQGYTVQRSDAVRSFVDYLVENGDEAQMFNLITDEFVDTYDLIFADAVLLHLTKQEVKTALAKIKAALNRGGKFSFSLKKGEGDEWSGAKLGAPRYFSYWQLEEITAELKVAGFTELVVVEGNQGRSNSEWLQIIAS